MMNRFSPLLAFPIFAFSCVFAQPAIQNPGFEEPGTSALPPGWSMKSGAGIVQRSASGAHEGRASLEIRQPVPSASTIESAPVRLTVGHPYRVTAWIRTDEVTSDPVARYPTALPATVTMASFPFTNHSTAVGATRNWTKVEATFFATQQEDRVRLHLGYNGTATGTAWFDDVHVEEVQDIATMIPMETVRWHGPAFRYTDKGWTFIHIEGEPYPRGLQYGTLMAPEIVSYIEKLSVMRNELNPEDGWNTLRTMTDALMLRGFKEEYLVEMRGIAEGAAATGAYVYHRPVDFLDIVTVNAAIDIGQLPEALGNTAHPLSGKTFRPDEDETSIPERLHKCSSFLANGPATADGRIVFGQIFMWRGYTGVHWDVICDLVPAEGHRLVYETFPGGIHSGADFYINDAGIMIGETTVMQTPFNARGTPQASRIREAAQYGSTIDDVVRILTTDNNGLYTNDWLIGDTRRNEIAILLLGTEKHRLWRSGANDWPGGTTGFYWSVNNAKDPEVRKEYSPDPSNAPFDLVFSPVNRDITFVNFYLVSRGKIDACSAVNILASSPVNRPHACDGKVTTSEMAGKLMFLAHYGKTTQREKFPEKNYRLMPDLPNAIPHLSLGYSAISPLWITDHLKAGRATYQAPASIAAASTDAGALGEAVRFPKSLLWFNTVYPATEHDNWFVSADAAYYRILEGLPENPDAAADYLRDQFAELDCRLAYTVAREGALRPVEATRDYAGYRSYQIPRIRGVYALHQLRLAMGNLPFSRAMNAVHTKFKDRPMTTREFLQTVTEVTGTDAGPIVSPWLERSDMPGLSGTVNSVKEEDGWNVSLRIRQAEPSYRISVTIALETGGQQVWQRVSLSSPDTTIRWMLSERPVAVTLNPGCDAPGPRTRYYTLNSFLDEYQGTRLVYGTKRQDEANRTLATRYQAVLADAFTEVLPELRKDCEVNAVERDSSPLIIFGGPSENLLAGEMFPALGIEAGQNWFRWNGRLFSDPDDGLMAAFPHPFDPNRAVYVVLANSALELYQMTKRHQRLPSWALFKGERVAGRGYHTMDNCQWRIDN
jgi:hypothetical protein